MSLAGESEVRAQLERILQSGGFRNADALRRLLAFLADRTLDGSAASLKEYALGVAVFGKRDSFDPQSDASVRVQMGKLRQRLEEYYRTEGAEDPVVIDLPRRQFSLKFQGREAAAAPLAHRGLRVAVMAAALLVAGLAGWLLGRGSAPQRTQGNPSPALRAFWKPLLESPKPPLLCLGSPMFLRFRGARLRYLDSIEESRNNTVVRQLEKLFGGGDAAPAYEYTGIGEATAAFLMARLFAGWDHPVEIRRDSALSWDEIKSNNLIFLGSAKYNPHLKQLPVEQNFFVEGGGVQNLHPAAGEPALYGKQRSDDEARAVIEDHALISRIPGLDGHSVIVWLGGSSTWSTWAAADCLVEAPKFEKVIGRIRAPKSGEIPPYFELVLRIRFRDLVPVETEYVTHRVIVDPRAGVPKTPLR